ncbi:hypothetical protein [Streptomyces cyslabdanicus]|uniref:hypothetical protein n=1 Tax=Streptomyces cyslabdanicus TaxID=1470456 RepID=UPI004043CB54
MKLRSRPPWSTIVADEGRGISRCRRIQPRDTAHLPRPLESFQEKDSAGFYIIAAAIIELDVTESAREAT